ncbi:MAG: DUF3310 domain-containing protein [Rickettsiales bacterium]
MTDKINKPAHYPSNPQGIECIDVTRHLNFNLGNVVKYIWRAGLKTGSNDLEDLKKARWYLNDEIKRRESAAAKAHFIGMLKDIARGME